MEHEPYFYSKTKEVEVTITLFKTINVSIEVDSEEDFEDNKNEYIQEKVNQSIPEGYELDNWEEN